MAVVRNITSDKLALFHADAPPIDPGDEVTISDEVFAERAWPKSTWALVKKPGKGFKDASPEDAYVFVVSAPVETAPADEETV